MGRKRRLRSGTLLGRSASGPLLPATTVVLTASSSPSMSRTGNPSRTCGNGCRRLTSMHLQWSTRCSWAPKSTSFQNELSGRRKQGNWQKSWVYDTWRRVPSMRTM
ncbi:unnamed protein product [Durusdinium trenchii]|uniref:Uncharacterized protein n=2 Tax=Durusdinium trenchii TaxID=1381693 RepID=A0ABP0QE15_9DINO